MTINESNQNLKAYKELKGKVEKGKMMIYKIFIDIGQVYRYKGPPMPQVSKVLILSVTFQIVTRSFRTCMNYKQAYSLPELGQNTIPITKSWRCSLYEIHISNLQLQYISIQEFWE